MFKHISKSKPFSPSPNSTQFSIEKIFFAPLTFISFGDCETLGRILGAAISYFEGYSSDEVSSSVEIRKTKDGRYVTTNHVSINFQTSSQRTGLSSTLKPTSVDRTSHVTVTSVFSPPKMDSFRNLSWAYKIGFLEGDKLFMNKLQSTDLIREGIELMRIYRETGLTVPEEACLDFVGNMGKSDLELAKKWKREFELELNCSQPLLNLWKKQLHGSVIKPDVVRTRRISKLEKKRRNNF